MGILRLYHTGFQIIESPDVKAGRKNADFGQGFYLSDNEEFSRRWARKRSGLRTYLNVYELETEGLRVKRFSRDEEWFGYIYANRANQPDALTDFDVITGPIANDTIYDTFGITTSGYLSKDRALRLLMIGPEYQQTAVKTEKAAAALRFTGAVELTDDEISRYRETVAEEQLRFQEQFAALLLSFQDETSPD